MKRLLECVPNFSEGASPGVISGFLKAVGNRVRLLDVSSDSDHNRTVLTLVGEEEAVIDAAFDLAAAAVRLIDMRGQCGVHPRIGAIDVLPLVPLSGQTRQECLELTHRLGARIGSELGLPVFYYAEAASSPERRRLADIRRGGFEELSRRMCREGFRPDEGPPQPHPSAGAVAVGLRPLMIAYNINLDCSDPALASAIAARIRQSGGGLPGLEALGFRLEGAGCTQVSLNIRDMQSVPLDSIYSLVAEEAASAGVQVQGAEIIGLLPLQAVADVFGRAVGLQGFSPSSILEWKLACAEGFALTEEEDNISN